VKKWTLSGCAATVVHRSILQEPNRSWIVDAGVRSVSWTNWTRKTQTNTVIVVSKKCHSTKTTYRINHQTFKRCTTCLKECTDFLRNRTDFNVCGLCFYGFVFWTCLCLVNAGSAKFPLTFKGKKKLTNQFCWCVRCSKVHEKWKIGQAFEGQLGIFCDKHLRRCSDTEKFFCVYHVNFETCQGCSYRYAISHEWPNYLFQCKTCSRNANRMSQMQNADRQTRDDDPPIPWLCCLLLPQQSVQCLYQSV